MGHYLGCPSKLSDRLVAPFSVKESTPMYQTTHICLQSMKIHKMMELSPAFLTPILLFPNLPLQFH